MPERLRRSSRIQKQVPIRLVGSDMEGRVFSEKTKTVVLSRYGAGIVSEYTLAAEQEVIIRLMETDKEAEVRVVGQLASQEGRHIYGVAFLNPNLDFWGIEFPPISDEEKAAGRKVLECSSCKGRETVEQTGVEADVFTINRGLVRYCQRCGSSTMWTLASDSPAVAAGAEDHTAEHKVPSAPKLADAQVARPADVRPSVTLAPEEPDLVAQEAKAQPSPRRENRRKHVRTKVNFKGCVRSQRSTKDIVTCEDMSRGGLRFKSSKRYAEKEMIEVAAPYSEGSASIFVAARIVFVQELANERGFRYGVAYTSDQRR